MIIKKYKVRIKYKPVKCYEGAKTRTRDISMSPEEIFEFV